MMVLFTRHSPPASQLVPRSGFRLGSLWMVSSPVGETDELCTVVEYKSRLEGARNDWPHEARSVSASMGL